MSRYCPSSSLGGIEEGVEDEDEVVPRVVQPDEPTGKQNSAVKDTCALYTSQPQLQDSDCDGLITDCALGEVVHTCSQGAGPCAHEAANECAATCAKTPGLVKSASSLATAINSRPVHKPCAHVVFVIDISGSMRKRDVAISKRKRQSRFSAVTACVADFLDQQVGSLATRNDVYSLVTFNEEGYSHFTCKTLTKAQKAVDRVLWDLEPCYGTYYHAGLTQALAACQVAESKKHISVGQHVVIFLSDGRPADLNPRRISPGHALSLLDSLKQQLGDKLQMHTVGFGKEQTWWLDMIAASAFGRFHDRTLPRGHDGVLSARALQETFRNISSSLTATRSIMSSALNSSSSTHLPKRVSREPPAQYLYSGTSAAGISMVADRVQACGVEVHTYEDGSCRLAHKTVVDVRLHPFAEGAQRLAYHAFDRFLPEGQQHLVIKPSRFLEQEDSLERLLPALKCVAVATEYAQRFNATLSTKPFYVAGVELAPWLLPCLTHISILECNIFRFERDSLPGIPFAPGSTHVYVPAEPFLRGHYIKYNGNNGHVAIQLTNGRHHESVTDLHHQLAQSFSHYTYHASGGSLLVCDIQGVGTTYTDPQVNSVDKAYGRSDMGQEGINKFFLTHKCNAVCSCLGIALEAAA